MNVSVFDIVNANQVFTKILTNEFTGKQAFMIGRIMRSLNTETEEFKKTRENILRKYAEVDENGEMIVNEGNVKIRDGEMENFQEEINGLLYAKLDLNITPIPVEWLDNIKLTPQETIVLEPFLNFDE